LQSPDDWEATYRQKRGEGYRGYVVNATETCNPENKLQLIVKVQTEANNTDDATMLDEALPNLKERTAVEQMNTDGGYSSADVDKRMRELVANRRKRNWARKTLAGNSTPMATPRQSLALTVNRQK
jgi:hypothetical protein